jgi:hypothetical protein
LLQDKKLGISHFQAFAEFSNNMLAAGCAANTPVAACAMAGAKAHISSHPLLWPG